MILCPSFLTTVKRIDFGNLQRLIFPLCPFSGNAQVISNRLIFKNVALEEDGVYQCVAENNLGMIVSSTWVNVLGNYH